MQKSLSLSLLTLVTAAALVLPAQASAAFEPGKYLSNLKDRVSNGAQRLYLRAVPGAKSGAAVLNQATMAMEKVSSMNMNITADVEAKQGGSSMGTAKITMDGPAELTDLYDPSTIKEHLNFKGEFSVEGVQISGAGEVIVDGTNAYYYKVTELPLPLQQYAKLKNQWVKMDLAKLKEDNKTMVYDAEFAKKYQEAANKLYKNATVSKARKEKWENYPVFVIDAEFDKDSLKTYIEEVMAIAAEQTEGEDTQMTDKDKEDLDKVIEALAPIKTTLWVDRSTFYLRHLETPMNVNVREFAEKVSGQPMTAQEMGPNMPDQVNVKVSMTFDQFNEPVTITIPEDARPAEEVMQEMMGGYMMGAPGRGSSAYPSYGSGYGSTYPSYPIQELPELTPAQQMQLEQYGYDY